MKHRHSKLFLFVLIFSFVSSVISFANSERVGKLLWSQPALIGSNGTPVERRYIPGVKPNQKVKDSAVRMGIIDSGVDIKHPQLSGLVLKARDFTGEGEADVLGHGTAVTLIALFGLGPDPVGAILSAKVVNKNGIIKEQDLINAIDWVVGNKAKVVNISLGFTGTREENIKICTTIEKYPEVIFVAAAGNSGPNVDHYPANCKSKNIIAVAELNSNGGIAKSSGTGDIVAPSNTPFVEEWRYYYLIAQNDADKGEFDQAREGYEKALKIQPNPESEYQIGRLDLQENKVNDAIKHFKKANVLNPGIAVVHEGLGTAFYIKGKYALAERSLREALSLFGSQEGLSSHKARAHYNLGHTLVKLERYDDARKQFKEASVLNPKYLSPE